MGRRRRWLFAYVETGKKANFLLTKGHKNIERRPVGKGGQQYWVRERKTAVEHGSEYGVIVGVDGAKERRLSFLSLGIKRREGCRNHTCKKRHKRNALP